jgi:cardiolipin synthase
MAPLRLLGEGLFALAICWGLAHAALHKQDSWRALWWVTIMITLPGLGLVFYLLFGIESTARPGSFESLSPPADNRLQESSRHAAAPWKLTGVIAGTADSPGNLIEPLRDGDQAYPAMLHAIEQAATSITLMTYIFGHDVVGLAFARALQRACARGVAVRILIDGVGERYSWPSMVGTLHRLGLEARRYPGLRPILLSGFNRRNHRKLMVVDGQIAFSGGLNIRDHHVQALAGERVHQDIHFRITGPVVSHLQTIFAEDWLFAAGEKLQGATWYDEALPSAGKSCCRVLATGPQRQEKLKTLLLAAVTQAQRRLWIQTPYFLPDQPLLDQLALAICRGVDVRILIPGKNNLPFVHWASLAQARYVLDAGCQLLLGAGPFNHSKLFLVDDHYAIIGSMNWDARSLRLNGELIIECLDANLNARLSNIWLRNAQEAMPLANSVIQKWPMVVQVRNALARLFMPIL